MIRKIFLSAGIQLLLAACLAFSQTVWQKYEGNPLLSGAVGPRVLKIGDLYKMWYIGLGITRQVCLATSVDGIHWTNSAANPLFGRGQPGDFDSDLILYGSVLFHDNQYWFWYSGYSYSGERWQIGLATSPDGIHWTKHPENPVLTVGFSWQWDANGVVAPAVIFDGHSFKMWYNGSGTQQAVGYAESSDGVHWTKHPQNPVLKPVPNSTWESQTVNIGSVLLYGRKFHAWYIGSKDGISRIGYATSADGITWERFADNPVLGPGEFNAWDNIALSGFWVLHENKALKMWYSGSSYDGTWKIGYAESKDNSSDDYALSFDGRNDFVSLPPNLISTPAVTTVETWVKYSSNKTDMMALSLEDVYGFYLNRFAAGTFTPFFDGSTTNGNDLGYGVNLNDNQWHHLAAVHAQGMTKIFVDGDSVGSVNESLYDINALNRASAIGAQFDGKASHFDGLIDEVRVWNVARTPGEIKAYMHLRLAGNESGLIGYWPGDEGNGQILHDAGPSGKHGQLGRSPNDDAADPHWVLANTDCQGIPLPAPEAYGNINGDDRFHPDKVAYCFKGRAGDWYLSFEAYDVDTNQEVDILLNGVKLFTVPLTANNSWSGLLGFLLPDELIHDDDNNELIFENTKNPPQFLLWGVRRVSIAPFFALPSPAAYGNIQGGDQAHADKVIYFFSGRPGDVSLVYEVYDIDNVNELEILLNGAKIHAETPTADNTWSNPRMLHLPDALVNDAGLNVLIFDSPNNPPQQWIWGVRNVRVETAPQTSMALDLSQSVIAEANLVRDSQYLFDGRRMPPARAETDDGAGIEGATTIAPHGYLVIDLQSVRQFDYLQLYPEWNAQRYFVYRIEGSLNGKDWQTVIDKSAAFVRGIQLDELPVTQARFLRIRGASFMADVDTLAGGLSEEAYWQAHDDLINGADSTDLAIAELALFQKQSSAPEIPIYPGVPTPQTSGIEFGVDILVGNQAKPVYNLFGVSFVLSFSPTNYLDVVAPYSSSVTSGSFMGGDVIISQTVNESAGTVSVVISRKAGQGGVNGYGRVARVKFVARGDIPDSAKVLFSITEAKANDNQNNPITLGLRSKSVMISNNVTVWPGDTNNDGVVNQADVLPIGFYWGSKGPARPNASINWLGQLSAPWVPLAATRANANGDTIVNQSEISAIGLNWGKVHSSLSSPANAALEKSQTPASATIMPEIIPAVQPPNQEFLIKIKVREVSNLFGLSLELAYDQPQLLQTLAVEPDSLFGNDVVFYSNLDTATGKIAVGISRKVPQSGMNGAGAVIRVKAKIAANAAVGTKVDFSLQDVTANDANGVAMNLNPQAASLTVSSTTGIDSNGETLAPTSYRLLQNHPNPFTAGTVVKYEIPQAGAVSMKIYNLAGQEILEIVNAMQSPGRYQINWDGRDSQGKLVPSGVYLCRIQADAFVQTQRMIMVR